MATNIRPVSRSASIPSKHLGREDSGKNLLQRSLVVRKLHGSATKENKSGFGDSKNFSAHNITTPTTQDLKNMRKRISSSLQNVECDEKSFDLLLRLLKTGSFIDDVIGDQDIQVQSRPSTPTPSLQASDTEDVTTIEPPHCEVTERNNNFFVDGDIVNQTPRNWKHERFSVKSVNSILARERSLHRRNMKNRKKYGRSNSTFNNSSSSSDSVEEENKNWKQEVCLETTRDLNESWLSLSGRQIELKHQNHVTRALTSSHIAASSSVCDIRHSKGKKNFRSRNIKSAPLSLSDHSITGLKGRKLAWGDRSNEIDRFVTTRLNKTLQRNKNLIDFSTSYHHGGFKPVVSETNNENNNKVEPQRHPPNKDSSNKSQTNIRENGDVKNNGVSHINESNPNYTRRRRSLTKSLETAYSVVSNQTEQSGIKSIIIHLPNSGSKQQQSTTKLRAMDNGEIIKTKNVQFSSPIEYSEPKLDMLKKLAVNHKVPSSE